MDGDDFKVCGLCSQLVVQSVFLEYPMRSFLLEFLNLQDKDLPGRICTDCFQGSYNSQRFKENCVKAIAKLKTSRIGDSMILGCSQKEANEANRQSSQKGVKPKGVEPLEPAAPISKTQKPKPKSASCKRVELSPENIFHSGPRSTRSQSMKTPQSQTPPPAAARTRREASTKATSEPVTPKSTRSKGTNAPKLLQQCKECHIPISLQERRLANRAQNRENMGNKRKRPRSLATIDSSPASKRERLSDDEPLATSSYGRVRSRSRKGREIDNEIEELFETKRKLKTPTKKMPPTKQRTQKPIPTPSPRYSKPRPSSRSPKPGPASRSPKPGPASRTQKPGPASRTQKPGPASRSQKPGPASRSPKPGPASRSQKPGPSSKKQKGRKSAKVEEDSGEEFFPSIGPYQCEICQLITKTKHEFVIHIKDNHLDIVDEEILSTLEKDLEKQKSKVQTEKSPKSTPSSKPGKKSRGPRSKVLPPASPEELDDPIRTERVSVTELSEKEKDALCLDGEVDIESENPKKTSEARERKKELQQDPIEVTDTEESMASVHGATIPQASPFDTAPPESINHSNHNDSFNSNQDYLPNGSSPDNAHNSFY